MKVVLTRDNGEEFDVTNDVAMLWDTVVSSMDWGSGFLDLEEMLQILKLGIVAGYDVKEQLNPRGYPSYAIDYDTIQKKIDELLEAYDQEDPTYVED